MVFAVIRRKGRIDPRSAVLLAVGLLAGVVLGAEPLVAERIKDLKTITIATPATPPEWALWQRHLLERLFPAAMEFVEKYTRPDGALVWRDRWPGMDGSDDGYESFYNFPLYYALGGPEEIHRLSRKLWEGVTRQFTRYGQVHKEFDAYYDWMHHGESYTNFYFFGLADPTVPKDRPGAAVRGSVSQRRPRGAQLRPGAQADPLTDQRQPRAPVRQHGRGLGDAPAGPGQLPPAL